MDKKEMIIPKKSLKICGKFPHLLLIITSRNFEIRFSVLFTIAIGHGASKKEKKFIVIVRVNHPNGR